MSINYIFYKVILDYEQPETKAIAFVLPNAISTLPISEYVVSIDSVEILTGINFFPSLPDEQENRLESQSQFERWEHVETKPDTQRCQAITKAGNQCRRDVTPNKNYCWQHKQ